MPCLLEKLNLRHNSDLTHYAIKKNLVEEQEPGVCLIRTACTIPDNELWLHEADARKDLNCALEIALNTKPEALNDLDALTRKINADEFW